MGTFPVFQQEFCVAVGDALGEIEPLIRTKTPYAAAVVTGHFLTPGLTPIFFLPNVGPVREMDKVFAEITNCQIPSVGHDRIPTAPRVTWKV